MNRSLFMLPVVLLSLLSLPQSAADRLRLAVVPSKATSHAPHPSESLALENHQLRSQLELAHEWLSGEKRLAEQATLLSQLSSSKSVSKEFLQRRADEMRSLLEARAKAVLAEVIYRDPGAWSSCCWINVGEEHNQAHATPIVAKNSPVVAGSSVVGVVDFVGKHQSRVRFITDSALKLAVRAVRGSVQDREVASLAHQLLEQLRKHPHLKADPAMTALGELERRLPVDWQDTYLAKGEVHGSGAPYLRALSSELKGVGFNCDFPDAEGPQRDPRTAALVKPGDALLTSGLDGVFPPGLMVAVVTHVEPLREGAFAYELRAAPAAGGLADLKSVFVLPPRGE